MNCCYFVFQIYKFVFPANYQSINLFVLKDMLAVGQPQQELRKSFYNKQNNPQKKQILLDKIGDKIGHQNFAYILMSCASVIFAAGYLYTNQNNFNICQNFLVRSIATISLNIVIARLYHIDIEYKDPHNFKILFIRNINILAQCIIFTVAQFYLTQPIIQTINNTGPLIIFILDYFINNVTISRKQFYGVVFGICGVLLTINGQYIYKMLNPEFQTKTDFKNYKSTDSFLKIVVSILFVCGNCLWAYAQVITKRLKGVNAIQINVHLGIFLMFYTGITYPTQVTDPVPTTKLITGIFLSGFVMAIGQILFIGSTIMTKNTGVLTMFQFVSVIYGYIVSVAKYNEPLNPFCIVGSLLILFGLGKIVLKPKRPQQQKNGNIQVPTSQNIQKFQSPKIKVISFKN